MSVSQEPAAPIPPIPGQVWLCGVLTGSTAFMAMIDSTLVNLALESIRADLSTDLASVQWIVSAYLVAMAVALPAMGWLGVRFGYGRVWLAATTVFTIASCLCAASTTLTMLLASRILQGLAGGLMVPAGQAVIASTTGPRQLGRVMGVLGLVVSLGPAIGPAIGGFLLEIASWPWLFLINLPIGVATVILSPIAVSWGDTSGQRSLDWRGLGLLGIGIPSLLMGAASLAEGGSRSISLLTISIGSAACMAYGVTSRWAASPLLDMRLFQNGTFAGATAMVVLTGANMYGLLLLLPLYFQNVTNLGTVEIGWMLLVMGLGSSAALPVAGWAVDRSGAFKICTGGIAILIATTLPFFLLPSVSMVAFHMLLFVRGVGLAWAQMPAMVAAYGVAEKTQMGDASALLNVAQRLGGAAGAILVVALIGKVTEQPSHENYAVAFAGIMGISIASIGPAWLLYVCERRAQA